MRIPLGRGRSLSIYWHRFTSIVPRTHQIGCSCTDVWWLWWVVGYDPGTCNFDELEKQWLGDE